MVQIPRHTVNSCNELMSSQFDKNNSSRATHFLIRPTQHVWSVYLYRSAVGLGLAMANSKVRQRAQPHLYLRPTRIARPRTQCFWYSRR